MFSVVIPVYNKQDFISKCLESVKNKNYNDLEMIIVNDGSKDNSLYLINKFKIDNPNIDITVLDIENKGVSYARNLGISKCKYDFICFLDADDYWFDTHLSNIQLLIKDFPDAHVFCSGFTIRKNNKKDVIKVCDIKRGYVSNFFESSIKNDIITSSTVCIEKECFSNISFPEGVTLTEDLYVWVYLALNFDIAYDKSITVVVNQFEDNSRLKRYTQLPYVVWFYHRSSNSSLIKYISYVAFSHLYAFKLNKNIKNYLKLMLITFKINKYLFFISIFIFFLPCWMIIFLKKFKSIILK